MEQTLVEFNNEYVMEKLEALDINDKEYANKAKVLADLQKNAIEAERLNTTYDIESKKLEASAESDHKKNKNEMIRNIVTGAGVAVSFFAAVTSFIVGKRATKNEEDYIHNNREGMQASSKLLGFVKKN